MEDFSNKPTDEELVAFSEAQKKWYPVIIETYNTKLLDLMANPFKKSVITIFIFFIIFTVCGGIYLFIQGIYPGMKMKASDKRLVSIFVIVGIVSLIVIYGFSVVSQYKTNEEMEMIIVQSSLDATKYDYENDPVIKSKLYRQSMSGRSSSSSSSSSSSALGALIGAGIGSRLSRSKR